MARAASASTTQEVQNSAREALGFLPNLIKELSEHNPAAAKLYLATTNLLDEGGSLTTPEQEVVLLTVSRYNDCHYCTSVHGKMAMSVGLDRETVETINSGGLPSDDRLRVLVQATRLMLDKRGWLDDEDLDTLKQKGVDRAELYEINALIGIKTFSNYVNHVAQTEIDSQFEF
ncbi:hypothetical protein BSZ35_07510 [Salinibacter sp. 10B]|uniref:carboxymuconolactone decarboxylase family protein n=1 Tax=Salinibacter sp. 10B TaxID=1923971 RepID=UPI000CF37E11|nr:carboxymuconolactone decarboxylase family protein [Salinibacter sp. 10B]PQJ34465.1 hypothetical protein BSZ35_07510 [Salinibacter sp. 10B]